MVPWAFSRPGDLNFDAFVTASSSGVLGSNRKAVVKRRRSFLAGAASSELAAGLASGRPSAPGSGLEKVSDSF